WARRVEDHLVGAAHGINVGARNPGALHAYDVEPAQPRVVARYYAVGDDVASDGGAPADKGVVADAGHLVDGGKTADYDIVADLDMAAERRDIGHGDVVANDAVMRDVGIGEEVAVVAH